MKKSLGLFVLTFLFLSTAYAADQSSSSTQPNQDTSVVDLSDLDTDQPVQSPSFENTTPAGQAPGQPIES